MKIFYIHGWASSFDPSSNKVRDLEKLGDVEGRNIDYSKSFSLLSEILCMTIVGSGADMIVGTSLGGYWAAAIGSKLGVPFVAINPAVDPATSLLSKEGKSRTYTGESITLTKEVISGYTPFSLDGCGLILLDLGDEVFSSLETEKRLSPHYHVVTFNGGSHRFAHMAEALNKIRQHEHICGLAYGLD
ncbi:MAG: hypothetical protein JKY94_08290 [Rhodobacteraceae bacterium]|nr:hypothetical protein [Paracoccaceae bacterium]